MTDIAVSNWPSGEPAQRWEDVASDNPDVRRRAFAYWAHNRELLPGPLAFMMEETGRLHAAWYMALQESTAQCACGRRRLLMPTASTYFYRPFPTERHTLTPASPPLVLRPWGNDVHAVSARVSVRDGALHQSAPQFGGLSRKELVEKGAAIELVPLTKLVDIAANFDRMPDRPYPVVSFIQTGPTQGGNGYTAITHYMLAVTAVHVESNTVVLAVNKNMQVVTANNKGKRHKCG